MAVRAPQLHHALRGFVLGAFAYLLRELEDEGDSLPFAFEEHGGAAGPALYEYRPLVRDFVEARADRLRGREDATIALDELAREPAAGIYARAHAGGGPSEDDALFRTVLVDLLIRVAEACGGFDWDDTSFDRAYAELERSLFGERRTYVAVAPLVGISTGIQRELGDGVRVRAAADGELARHWPEAKGLLPSGFGREPDRYCVIELRSALGNGEDVPDAPAEIADAVSAIRLATAAPLAAGPVLFETLDGRPTGSGRCFPSRRRSLPASRPGSTSFAGRSPPSFSSGSGSPMRTRTSRRRSTGGSCRSSSTSRSARSSFVRRSVRSSAAPGRSGRPCCSRRSPSGVRRCTATWRRSETAPRRPRPPRPPFAARSSRSSARAIATGLVDRLDRMLLGLSVPERLRVAS